MNIKPKKPPHRQKNTLLLLGGQPLFPSILLHILIVFFVWFAPNHQKILPTTYSAAFSGMEVASDVFSININELLLFSPDPLQLYNLARFFYPGHVILV